MEQGSLEKVFFFAAKRTVIYVTTFALTVLQRLKAENSNNISKVVQSLEETEEFLKKTHGIDVDLKVFVKHIDFLDVGKYNGLRKEILDRSNDLIRTLEREITK